MKFNRDSVKFNAILLILFLINPVVSLIGSTFMMCFKKIDTSLVMALSLSLILIYFPIMYDTSSNFFTYYYNNGYKNIYLSFPSYVRDALGIHVNFIMYIYIYTVLIVYVWANLIYKQSIHDVSVYYMWMFLIFFWFTFTYRDVMDLHRTILSFCIFFYWFYSMIENKKLNYILLFLALIISINIHSVVILLWSIYLVSTVIKLKNNVAIMIFVFSCFLGIFLPNLLSFITPKLNLGIPIIDKFVFYVTDENWGVRENLSLGVVVKKSFEYLIILVSVLLAIWYKKNNVFLSKENQIFYNFVIIISSLSVLFVLYLTFFERLSLAVFFLSIFLVFRKNNQFLKICLLSLFIVKTSVLFIFIQSVVFFGDYSEVLPDTNAKLVMMSKPFVLPTIMLLNVDENGYSDQYIHNHSIWYRDWE